MRIPSKREEAASAGLPFMGLEIEISTETVHVGLHPLDLRLLVALWFDNLSINYFPPRDLRRRLLPPHTTQMRVKLTLAQAVIWIHPRPTGPPIHRLQLGGISLLVLKAIGRPDPYVTGKAEITLGIRRVQ